MGRPRKNLIGQRSGKLVVVRLSEKPPNSNNSAYWWCRCDCGGEREVDARRLREGHPKQALACLNCIYTKDGRDLLSLFPDIAQLAYGWDPSREAAQSTRTREWRCPDYEHTYLMKVRDKTNKNGSTGCPYCSGKRLLIGFNDLLCKHPEIAKDAHNWDPTQYTSGCGKRMQWKCSDCGHEWSQTINKRTPPDPRGCPLCAGQVVVAGINDLATTHPFLAAQAHGWDPTKISHGAMNSRHSMKSWKCPKCARIFKARVANRTRGRGCPYCAEYGYNQSEEGWMYLMYRPGEQQFGISNDPKNRIQKHEKTGWQLLDLIGPFPGDEVFQSEFSVKKWLKNTIKPITGTEENWETVKLEVQTLKELFELADIPQALRLA